MGHSQAAKAATRQRIIQIAARRFREHGMSGVGLAEITAEAGVTTGAFYRHFASREEMLAEAFDEAARSLDTWAASSPDLASALRNYLSTAHRDAPGSGCPIVALANDAARGDAATRHAYTHHVQRVLRFLEGLLAAQGCSNPRAMAIFQFSTCVGAMGLARASADPALSVALLDDVANGLNAIGAKVPARPG
ncbi:TetR/AcrR family transcriptional regulator [Cupriavidus sp. 2TAF22]|uniref:TetR/AcrR family transcriptional regulator n=1 Tax=unclassified Cupriavidus TaxID=2640874 RepID=UPI003F92AE0D